MLLNFEYNIYLVEEGKPMPTMIDKGANACKFECLSRGDYAVVQDAFYKNSHKLDTLNRYVVVLEKVVDYANKILTLYVSEDYQDIREKLEAKGV
jgi:hypothetical protein